MKDNIELNYLATKLRKQFGHNDFDYIDIFENAKMIKGLSLVLLPLSENISGICIKQEGANVIAINSAFSYGRQRFSLAHELYHLYFDMTEGTTISTFDYIKGNDIENEANIFASYYLLPYQALRDELENIKKLTKKELLFVENKFVISHSALLFRLLDEKIITQDEFDNLNKLNLKKLCNEYNFNYNLYETNNIRATYGNYINQVDALYAADMISKGRKEELLTDCFREDLLSE